MVSWQQEDIRKKEGVERIHLVVSLLSKYLHGVSSPLQAVSSTGGGGWSPAQSRSRTGEAGGEEGGSGLVVRMGGSLVLLQHRSHAGVRPV